MTMSIELDGAIEGVAAGVPFVALPPSDKVRPAPLVLTWHLLGAPFSEAAMAAALPMRELHAWRVHLGLPLTGKRFPEGGFEGFFCLASEDNVLNVVEPLTKQVEAEFPAAVAELRSRLSIEDGPVGLVGGSQGGGVALQMLTHTEIEVAAAALVNPVTQLAPMIAANERVYDVTYPWSDRSRAVANEYDYVRRAGELTAPVLLVIGGEDDVSITEPAEALHKVLGEQRSELVTIPGMAHEFAEAPGLEPAPQTEHAKLVDAELTRWFARHLAV